MGAIGDLFNLIFTYPIFNGLVALYHLFGDFALAIVVLTVIIKLILFPLTIQQLRSTKAMQALQPQIADLKKKHGKDQQAFALAQQQLYKEYGINPAAGCLPLLIQLPVLYGLFYALNGIVRENNIQALNAHLYAFVPKFVHMPNLTFTWLSWLSFLHPILPGVNWAFPLNQPDPTHILPVLAGLATFISLRMSQPKPTQTTPTKASAGSAGNVADVSAQTMKTMQYVMPFFTIFIGWTFPAGLALYWTVSSVFQAVQQYFVTGWGSLLTTPTVQPIMANNKIVESNISQRSYTGDSKRQRELEQQAEEVEINEEEDGAEGPISQNLHTSTPRPNGTSAYTRRRKSSNSASARRRSAQKSRT